MYNYIHGDNEAVKVVQGGNKMVLTEGKFKHKKLKASSVNQSIKEKLERSALERFHQASIIEKEVSHQGASEKKA